MTGCGAMSVLCSTAGILPFDRMTATNSTLSAALCTTSQPAQPTAGATAGRLHPTTAASGFCSFRMDGTTATAAPCDRSGDDMNATAMSIDTPSYARSLGMGQPGSAAGFAGSFLDSSQDLAQTMSIDGSQAEHISDGGAVASGTGEQLRYFICISSKLQPGPSPPLPKFTTIPQTQPP